MVLVYARESTGVKSRDAADVDFPRGIGLKRNPTVYLFRYACYIYL